MSKFFVGQRVRLVKSVKANPTGATGIIVSMKAWPKTNDGYRPNDCDCEVMLAGLGLRAACFWQLEPILDQHQPCESDFKESLDKLLEGLPA